MREVIHDRTIRVAERGPTDTDGAVVEDGTSGDGPVDDDSVSDNSSGDEPAIVGVVGFDAEREAVHVTHLAGDETAYDALLAEPVRFARTVELPVRMLVPESDEALRTAVEDFGFEEDGFGPRFDGTPTRRYRYD